MNVGSMILDLDLIKIQVYLNLQASFHNWHESTNIEIKWLPFLFFKLMFCWHLIFLLCFFSKHSSIPWTLLNNIMYTIMNSIQKKLHYGWNYIYYILIWLINLLPVMNSSNNICNTRSFKFQSKLFEDHCAMLIGVY